MVPQANTRGPLNSLRNRYVFAAAVMSLFLAAAALAGWYYVDRAGQDKISNIQQRSEASGAVTDINHQIRALEAQLQRFLIQPINANLIAVQRSFELMEGAIERLKTSQWVAQRDTLHETTVALRNDSDHLKHTVEGLMEQRLDESSWFPALDLMQERMLPANLAGTSSLEQAINETSPEGIGNAAYDPSLHAALLEVRHVWLRLISEFRLYVANRFGIFTRDIEVGMASRRENIAAYAQHLEDLLKELEEVTVDSIVVSSALQQLNAAFSNWMSAYGQVAQVLRSDRWRQDIVRLEREVDPAIADLWQRLSTLELELGIASARDVTALTQIARQLSLFVIALAAGAILFTVMGFLVFHRTLLKPIAQVTQALKWEAKGRAAQALLPAASTTEVLHLTDAFDEMREQVRRREANLEHLAHHDPLTELPNRVLFRDRLDQAMERMQRTEDMVGVLFLDLDRFKQINDSLGHLAGDQLLKMVTKRLLGCVRAGDTVARLGGDEFAIMVEDAATEEQIVRVAEKILSALREPFVIDQQTLHVTGSLGLAICPISDSDTDALIRDADIAMYHAKDDGRNQYRIYSADMKAYISARLALEIELRRAADLGQFEVYYQPILDLDSGTVTSLEALLRWNHPQRGVVSAGEIIDLLDESGMIVPVTRWALKQICQQQKLCVTEGYDLGFNINLSGRLLKDQGMIEQLTRAVECSAMQPHNLVVEITEDTLAQDFRASHEALSRLSRTGIRIALDDFGTRQSSLNHLRGNPIDIVKIDRDFVRDIPGDDQDSRLVSAIVAMAHQLGMRVVAEGVETVEQLEFLRAHGADAVQGYLYSQAVPGSKLISLLRDNEVRWRNMVDDRPAAVRIGSPRI